MVEIHSKTVKEYVDFLPCLEELTTIYLARQKDTKATKEINCLTHQKAYKNGPTKKTTWLSGITNPWEAESENEIGHSQQSGKKNQFLNGREDFTKCYNIQDKQISKTLYLSCKSLHLLNTL